MNEQKNWVIDANIILRHVLKDLPEQAQKVDQIIAKAAGGSLKLFIPKPVVSDLVFVLSYMKVPKAEIAEAVRGWVNLPGVQLLGMELLVLETALDLFVEKNIKWSDALFSAKMLKWGFSIICTFDKRFTRVPGLTMIDPLKV